MRGGEEWYIVMIPIYLGGEGWGGMVHCHMIPIYLEGEGWGGMVHQHVCCERMVAMLGQFQQSLNCDI